MKAEMLEGHVQDFSTNINMLEDFKISAWTLCARPVAGSGTRGCRGGTSENVSFDSSFWDTSV